MLIKIPQGWEIPEREATPEHIYLSRRASLKAAGFLGTSGLLAAEVKRNTEFTLDRPITEEWAATSYNNYYEFHPTDKQAVRNNVGAFITHPWKIDVGGLCNKPGTLDLDDLLKKFPVEERLYRFRCVEAWAMAVRKATRASSRL
jgi:methionine sulfoxide reductase catalytic subunit